MPRRTNSASTHAGKAPVPARGKRPVPVPARDDRPPPSQRPPRSRRPPTRLDEAAPPKRPRPSPEAPPPQQDISTRIEAMQDQIASLAGIVKDLAKQTPASGEATQTSSPSSPLPSVSPADPDPSSPADDFLQPCLQGRTMAVNMNSNILDLPTDIYAEIVQYIEGQKIFSKVATVKQCQSDYAVRNSDVAYWQNGGHGSATDCLLRWWAELGMTVREFAGVLDTLRLETPLTLIMDPEPLTMLENPPYEVNLEEGDTLRLECNACGFPYPRYTWFLSKEEIDTKFDGLLEIPDVRKKHEGHYMCRVHNNLRDQPLFTNWCNVVVKEMPQKHRDFADEGSAICGELRIIEEPTDKTDQIKGTVIFNVLAKGPAPLSYEWYHNREAIPGACDPELKFVIKSMADQGEYHCHVSCHGAPPALSRAAKLTVQHGKKKFFAHEKLALVLGQSRYRANCPPLPAVRNDVEAAKKVLERLGFKVLSFLDLTLQEMETAVELFCSLLRGDTGSHGVYAVLYLAGHGLRSDGQQYLMPWNHSEGPQPSNCLCVEEVEDKISATNPAFLYMMVDLCRLFCHVKDMKTMDPRVPPKAGKKCIAFYAASREEKCFEDKKRGVFSKHILEVVQAKVSVFDTYKQFQEQFRHYTFPEGYCQTPEYSINLQEYGRSLWDPKELPEMMTDSQRESLRRLNNTWEILTKLPNPIPTGMVCSDLMLSISYHEFLSNALEVHVTFALTLEREADARIVFEASIHGLQKNMKPVESRQEDNRKTVLTICNIQKLEQDMAVFLDIRWSIAGEVQGSKRLPLNIEQPLVACGCVWSKHRDHVLQLNTEDDHNADKRKAIERKQPTEQEDEKSLT